MVFLLHGRRWCSNGRRPTTPSRFGQLKDHVVQKTKPSSSSSSSVLDDSSTHPPLSSSMKNKTTHSSSPSVSSVNPNSIARNEAFFRRSASNSMAAPKAKGIYVSNGRKNDLFHLYRQDPEKWTISALAQRFQLNKARVFTILRLKELEWATFGNLNEDPTEEGKEVRESVFDVYPPKERMMEAKDFIPHPPAQDPLLEFLKDEDEPTVIIGTRNSDSAMKVYQDAENHDEVLKRQSEAVKIKVGKEEKTEKQFPTFENRQRNRWKIAIKDLSRPKAPLKIRDEDGQLRLATPQEAINRSWVRRPPAINAILTHHGKSLEETCTSSIAESK